MKQKSRPDKGSMKFCLLMPEGVPKPENAVIDEAMGQVERMLNRLARQAPEMEYDAFLFSAVVSAYFLGALEGGRAVHEKYGTGTRVVVQ